MSRSYYDILGVPRDADAKTIKKAFRKLAAQSHPDRNKDDPEAEDRFKELNRAYDVLGDAEKRKMYDEFGEDAEKLGFDPEKARAYRQWQSQGGVGYDGSVDIEELLSQLFGGGGGPAAGGFGGGFGGFRGRGGPRGARRGGDVRAELGLDFTTAVLGGERTLGIDGRNVTVRIPPGVKDGGTLRLRGQGLAGAGGGPAGDLLLTLRVAPDPLFRREGDDLRIDAPVTLGELLRGASIEVPTIDGAVRVKVPAGAQPGQSLRVRGRGVSPRGRAPGDLLVTLKLELPDVSGQDVEAAIDALEALYEGNPREALDRRRGQAAA